MADIWSQLIEIKDFYIQKFDKTGQEYKEVEFNQTNWYSRTWTSEYYRRAHIAIADLRDTKGIWMMHCCVFPHISNNAPIFGYDVVAGKNKITGFFHDFSSTGNLNHTLIQWFKERSSNYEWNKTRELPEWGKVIFSPYMIAASNINEQDELGQILEIGKENLEVYLDTIRESDDSCVDNSKAQNFYCLQQRLNPHNPRVMLNLGLNEENVRIFIEDCLFPLIR